MSHPSPLPLPVLPAPPDDSVDDGRAPHAAPAIAARMLARRAPAPAASTAHDPAGPRWGLCCQFTSNVPRFRTATHRYVSSLEPAARRAYLSAVVRSNAIALAHAVERCAELGIGAFRINSQLLPLATHPVSGYRLEELDQGAVIVDSFRAVARLARARGIRLSFHPDQFVVLNSEHERTVAASLREMETLATVAELVGADTLTLHGGGLAGGMPAALERLERGLDRLSPLAHALVALENDDRLFAPRDLVPLCARRGIGFVYDVHHHRCHPDGLSIAEATDACAVTWGGREPFAHIASPRDGWTAANPRPHADLVDDADFPEEWRGRRLTVDVEAKAKERAVLALRDAVAAAGESRGGDARAPLPGVADPAHLPPTAG